MLAEIVWPAEIGVDIDEIHLDENTLVIAAHGTQLAACCPICGSESSRINGSYCRHPADLPCSGYAIELALTVPRFFCDNEVCERQTFAATFPAFVAPYARRTHRLVEQERQVGLTLSAEQGAYLLSFLGMVASPDTLLRLVRGAPEPVSETPRVLGVDDWAKSKGRTYGTILVDLERHQVVDLLDDRSAESLARWLQEHPGVEIISRDRGGDYIEGASRGAPDAIQIADRFHLLHNMVDALKRMFAKSPAKLREAARQVAEEAQIEYPPEAESIPRIRPVFPTAGNPLVQPIQQTLRALRFAEVKDLQAQGWSRRTIAQHLRINPRTVSKYFGLESCPQRTVGASTASSVLPYLPYLTKRWHEGCNRITRLHAELQALGYAGHYSSVYRIVKRLLHNGDISVGHIASPVSIPRLSTTEAAWLLAHPKERLDDRQLLLRDKLCQLSHDIRAAYELAQSFCAMIRNRAAEALDLWLEQARTCKIKALENFAVSLQRDYAAVKAALTYGWSNGQVEGQVNRLKLIKRKMYGRANFDLLRKHVLAVPIVRT